MNRLQSLPISDIEKSELFSHLYIGKQDEWFGELASAFSRKTKVLQDRRDTYDISEFEDLPYFEADDTISPPIIQSAVEYFTFYGSLLENDTFKMLMTRSAEDRCRWFAKRNENIVIRDADWEKIYDDICTTPESFERYFPMMCVGITSESVNALIRAIVLNDDFYQYICELEKESKEGKNK